MMTIGYLHVYALFLSIIVSSMHVIRNDFIKQKEITSHHIERRQACSDPTMCRSKWGYCGMGEGFCDDGCIGGPCSNGGNNSSAIITERIFACVFNTIDGETRTNRLNGLRNSGWKPLNTDEAAVFLAHVYHESDGLKTIREYCAPGEFS